MKLAILTASALSLASLSAFGQGAIVFKNFGSGSNGSITPIAYIHDLDTTTRLTGANWSVQLYGGATSESMTALGSPIGFLSGVQAGLFGSPTLTVPGVAIGASAVFQVFVWNNAGGTLTSYEQASIKGASGLINVAALGDPTSTTPNSVPTLVGLTSFSVVPEPSTIALAAVGAGLLFFRRKTA